MRGAHLLGGFVDPCGGVHRRGFRGTCGVGVHSLGSTGQPRPLNVSPHDCATDNYLYPAFLYHHVAPN